MYSYASSSAFLVSMYTEFAFTEQENNNILVISKTKYNIEYLVL